MICRGLNKLSNSLICIIKVSKLKFLPLICDNSNINSSCTRFLSSKCSSSAPWRILFFGSDNFALRSLELLCSKYRTGTVISKLEVVVSNPNNLVAKYARNERLNTYLWPIQASTFKGDFDLGIVVSFGHLVPKDVIENFPLGILNAHASLLPRWRGASPIAYAIMNGDNETGVTIMKIKPDKFDTGDIVRQYRCSIQNDETTPELESRLAQQSANLLIECIRDLPRSVEMCAPQPDEGKTHAPKLDKKLSNICWETMTSREIYNRHRALSHVYPLRTQWNKYSVKLLNIKIDASSINDDTITVGDKETIQIQSALSFLHVAQRDKNNFSPEKLALSFLDSAPNADSNRTKIRNIPNPGLVNYDKSKNILNILCCDGGKILVEKVCVVGKKTMDAADFYNGFISKVKEVSKRRFS